MKLDPRIFDLVDACELRDRPEWQRRQPRRVLPPQNRHVPIDGWFLIFLGVAFIIGSLAAITCW